MQTWAKRGVHAALVTGGMLAVGSGVAAASGAYPEGPASPLGESVLPPVDDDPAGENGPDLAGELFPGETSVPPHLVDSSGGGRHALPHGKPVRVIAGTIDPVHDLLPVLENETTRELPAVVDDSAWFRTVSPTERTMPMPRLELAGWVAEPSTAVEHPAATPPRGKHAQRGPNTPSEGFHRSLSWTGGIGQVVHDEPQAAEPADREGPSAAETTAPDLTPVLAVPSDDPTTSDDPTRTDGPVELRRGGFDQPPAVGEELGEALLEVGTDLTTSHLAGPRYVMHRVPPALVAESVSAVPPVLAPRPELMSLRVPGEALAKASEIPPLTDLVLRGEALGPPRSRSGVPEVHEELPLVGELNAGGGGDVSAPTFSRIVEALAGEARRSRMAEDVTLPSIPKVPAFTDRPLESIVDMLFVDELDMVSELRQATQNPFRSTLVPRAATPEPMALPVFDALPDITAVQGETLSSPLDEVLPDLADTVVLERV